MAGLTSVETTKPHVDSLSLVSLRLTMDICSEVPSAERTYAKNLRCERGIFYVSRKNEICRRE